MLRGSSVPSLSGHRRIISTAGMQFMEVRAGKFQMGSRKKERWADINEWPHHRVDLPYDYYMARLPITNEEYAAYQKSEQPEFLRPKWKENSDYPAVNVSWKGAIAYCRWLNKVLKGELPFGLILRLPTEAEWEKAARGAQHLIYPWGNVFETNKNNSAGSAEEGTASVAKYSPQGDSPYGCADMTGNVWQWTHSLLKDYPYNAEDGRESEETDGNHVSRGGSRFMGQGARCASRNGISDNANFAIGFRVVISIQLPVEN